MGREAVAIGVNAGFTNRGFSSIAIGANAGLTGSTGATGTIAIGRNAGFWNQGANSVAIGNAAGFTGQHARTIAFNAQTTALNTDRTDATFIAPIRNTGTENVMYYNSTTSEVTYATGSGGPTGPAGSTGSQGSAGSTNVVTTQDSVGSYAFCEAALALQFGATVSGSNLIPCAADGTSGTTTSLSGTWRCMGRILGTPPSTYGSPTLFVRIS